jgi:hypothetical protein
MKALFLRILRCPASMNFRETRGNRWATTQISMQGSHEHGTVAVLLQVQNLRPGVIAGSGGQGRDIVTVCDCEATEGREDCDSLSSTGTAEASPV